MNSGDFARAGVALNANSMAIMVLVMSLPLFGRTGKSGATSIYAGI
jgi:hypothetical protein